MSTHVFERRGGLPAARLSLRVQHVVWLGAGLVFGFLVSFVLADTLGLPRDLYYGIYAVSVAAFFAAWVKATGQSFGEMLRRRWRLALVLGFGESVARLVKRDRLEACAAPCRRGFVLGSARRTT